MMHRYGRHRFFTNLTEDSRGLGPDHSGSFGMRRDDSGSVGIACETRIVFARSYVLRLVPPRDIAV
jgi:hypothetical protein